MVPNYASILRKNGIELDAERLQRTDISVLDSECILALITGAIRAERFCDGTLKDIIDCNVLDAWLLRLKELDCM